MTAYEVFPQSQTFNLLMHRSFYTPNVSENQSVMEIGRHHLQVFGIKCHRGTEENVVAVAEIVIDRRAGYMNDRFLCCKCQCFFIIIECNYLVIRIVTADGPGNGPADQSETNKSDFLLFHS